METTMTQDGINSIYKTIVGSIDEFADCTKNSVYTP